MTLAINDAHRHFGRNSIHGSLGRLTIPKLRCTYSGLVKDLDKYNIKKSILFPQPDPYETGKDLLTTIAALSLPYLLYNPCVETILSAQALALGAIFPRIYEDLSRKPLRPVNYKKANRKIYGLEDERIDFIPLANHNFKLSDLDSFEGFKGIKFYYGEPTEGLLEYMDENNLNMILHPPPQKARTKGVFRKVDDDIWHLPSNFLKTVNRYDGIKFQVAHLARGDEQIINALGKCEHDNLYTDSSGLTFHTLKASRKNAAKIIPSNPEHVLFGSDWPWTDTGKEIAFINGLELGEKERESIFYSNYFKLWGDREKAVP
ncbi:MAG: amidohydrolase family protein [Candidatus Aenigmarchaeota archaeon]|nr:amidohydrolase family protein [Candidatus Aenigmarchaeota archaeon]